MSDCPSNLSLFLAASEKPIYEISDVHENCLGDPEDIALNKAIIE